MAPYYQNNSMVINTVVRIALQCACSKDFYFHDCLKVPDPISQNVNFYSNDASSPKISWFQISFKSVKPFGHKKRLRILQLPILPYTLLCKFNYGYHN